MLQSGVAMECSTLEREKSCPQLIHACKQEEHGTRHGFIKQTKVTCQHARLLGVIIRQFVSTIHSKMSLRDVPAEAWSHFRPIDRYAANEAKGDFGPS
jgi:hypothetical protein